jgi:23S rRNA G2445 N2-methylase RlmL
VCRWRRLLETAILCELEVTAGLGPIARDELQRALGPRAARPVLVPAGQGYDVIRCEYAGDLRLLLRLRTVHAAYIVRRYAVPRPRGLLGDEHLRALASQLGLAQGLFPREAFRTLHVSAAGADSPVLRRLQDELARRAGLAVGDGDGDLLVRLRRPAAGGAGWEALVRLTPRPLAARAWRVCNLPGALNAPVAHAMGLLTGPNLGDVFVNLACGSGTLLIERLAIGPARRAVGCDTSAAALDCARANLDAAGLGGGNGASPVELYPWDARALPLPAGTVDALCADLPFGHLMGSHGDNLALYPAILREAARVARRGAAFALVTYEARLTEAALRVSAEWAVAETLRIRIGTVHARIFVLRRR